MRLVVASPSGCADAAASARWSCARTWLKMFAAMCSWCGSSIDSADVWPESVSPDTSIAVAALVPLPGVVPDFASGAAPALAGVGAVAAIAGEGGGVGSICSRFRFGGRWKARSYWCTSCCSCDAKASLHLLMIVFTSSL